MRITQVLQKASPQTKCEESTHLAGMAKQLLVLATAIAI